MIKNYRFVVAMKDGKFFHLDIEYATTTPSWVDFPGDAHRVYPWHPEEPLKHPTYYFENSSRMHEWLYGSEMVWVELICNAEVKK